MSMTISEPHPRRWTILAAVIAVLLMTPLDSSAVNVIIPVLQQEFNAPLGQVAWVPLVYLVIIASLLLPIGRLGDLWGFRRVFLTGVAVFTLASALCGVAPGLGWLVGARVLQGLGACMMMALSSGITAAIFPPNERGRALGLVGMGIAFGLVLGPTLGGLLTELWNWRLIFFINLPIGIAGGLWVRHVLPTLDPHVRHRVDWMGALLIMFTLAALMLAITQGQEWGWASPTVLGLLAMSVVLGSLFVVAERRHPAPMLAFSLFSNPVFTGANIASMMNFLGQFSALFLTPLLLQRGLGFTTRQTGLVMGTLPLMVLVVAPISGALSDRYGTRALAVTGETLVTIGLLGMAAIIPRGHLYEIIPTLTLIGVGAGLFQSPNNNAIMSNVPRTHLGVGGGVLATMRNLGMALGIAISSAVAAVGAARFLQANPGEPTEALIRGIQLAFMVGAGFTFLGALTSAARAEGRQV